MNKPKCTEYDYINFLVAAQRVFSALEAARTQPYGEHRPAHDAALACKGHTRLLQRLPADSEGLWAEVRACIRLDMGLLVIDDTTLDKPYARQMALVTRHWSGKHRAVVQGINLISLVWTDGNGCLPCDFRLYNKAQDGLDKNDHFQAMLGQAKQRGFQPRVVTFGGWCSSLKNLKLLRDYGWDWLTRFKANRQVSLRAGEHQALSQLVIPATGLIVHLRGYGLIRVFRTVAPHGDAEYWATNRLTMTEPDREAYAARAWLIETYHRGLKQLTGVQAGQFRLERAQRKPHRAGYSGVCTSGVLSSAPLPRSF